MAHSIVDEGRAITSRLNGIVLATPRAIKHARGLGTTIAVQSTHMKLWNVDLCNAFPNNRQSVARLRTRQFGTVGAQAIIKCQGERVLSRW